MDAPNPNRHWYRPTPAWLVQGSVAVTGLLFLSERWRWFGFNGHKGYTVLIAVTAVAAVPLFMLLWFAIASFFRLRFQFSVLSLLVLVVAVALPFSWLAMEMKKARQQREVARAMGLLGAKVLYDDELVYEDDGGPVAFSFGEAYYLATGRQRDYYVVEPLGPKWLRDRLGDDFFRTVLAVQVEGEQAKAMSGSDLRQIGRLVFLKRLMLDDAESLSDADLAALKGLGQLERLFLKGTQITDSGLRELSDLTNLRYLSLRGTKITDDGLACLRRMTVLEMLELSDTNISDEGLKYLRGLHSLKVIYLDGAKVTEKGVKELQAALPDCGVLLCGPGVIG